MPIRTTEDERFIGTNIDRLLSRRNAKPKEAQIADVEEKGVDLFFGDKERRLLEIAGREMVIDILKESSQNKKKKFQ